MSETVCSTEEGLYMTLLFIAALAPAVALMIYIYRKDKVEPEPIGLVLRVFFLGAASGLVASLIESILISAFEAAIPPGTLLLIVEYFVGVAAVEEACKYFCLNTVKNNPAFDYVFDAVVYSVAAALGFAALENVFYVMAGGIETAIMRAIFSVPGHAADGVVMGVFYGIARQHELHGRKAKATQFYWLAFLLPVIEHGFYDWALSTESDVMALVAMAFDLVFIAIAFVLVRKKSVTDEPLHPRAAAPSQAPVATPYIQPHLQQPAQPQAQQATSTQPGWYCPNCGAHNSGNFCVHCGTKRP